MTRPPPTRTLEEDTTTIYEAIAIFEALRRLGFRSEHIFFVDGKDGQDAVLCVCLRGARGQEFTRGAGKIPPVGADRAAFTAALRERIVEFNAGQLAGFHEFYHHESCVVRDGVQLMLQLTLAGFKIAPGTAPVVPLTAQEKN